MPRAFGTEMSITRRRAGSAACAIAILAVYSARSATSHACSTEAPQAMMPWRARSITCVSAGAAPAAAPTPAARSAEPEGAGGATGGWWSRSPEATVTSGIGSPPEPKGDRGRRGRGRPPPAAPAVGARDRRRAGRGARRRDPRRAGAGLGGVRGGGNVVARDVEGGPGPVRGEDAGEAEGRRPRRAEAGEFHRHEPLVVVEG